MSEQQITSPEELGALPVGSVVRWVHNGCIWERWPLGWMTTGNAGKCQSEHVGSFPAVLLYRPDAAPVEPRTLPTEAEVAEAIKSGWFEGVDEFGKYGPQFDPLSAARAVLARLAAQPTEQAVRADVWDESSKATSEAIFSSRDARGVCISWVIPTNSYRESEG